MGTERKRLIIIFFYLAIFGIFALALYFLFLKPEETCFDGIKNQNEQKSDCGGVCEKCQEQIEAQPLLAGQSGYVFGGSGGQYDFWGEVTNPNNAYGAQNFTYEIVFKISGGAEVRKTGQNFILPGEKKYIILTNVGLENPQSVEFFVGETSWVEFKDYYERPQLKIVNKNYREITSGTGFSEAWGLLKNESPFDFNVIKVGVILRDGNDNVLALNSTEMRTVISREEREFRVMWPVKFPGSVEKIEPFAEINIFDSEAFFKRYFEQQKL